MTDEVLGAPGEAADSIFEGWQDLTWRQRRERRFEQWLRPPGVEFAGEDKKRLYQARVQGVIDAVELKKPARLPVYVMLGMYPARWSGWSAKDAMSDFKNFAPVWGRLHEELDFDFVSDGLSPSPFYETIGAKFIKWPGHRLGDNSPWQYSGEEHMKDDEYDRLIDDPSNFWLRSLLPRMVEAFEPFEVLYAFTQMWEAWGLVYRMLPFADPALVAGLHKLSEAAAVALDWVEAYGAVSADLTARCGVPVFVGSTLFAPYDVLGDMLRGTRGIAKDRFRQPDKILAATEHLVLRQVETSVSDLAFGVCSLVCIPLHKGADGWMSDADFRRFYWPTLKTFLRGLIDEGAVPFLYAEGSYNQRLLAIVDDELPAGSVIWYFEGTDMVAAKLALGGYACICGNVPAQSLALDD